MGVISLNVGLIVASSNCSDHYSGQATRSIDMGGDFASGNIVYKMNGVY